MKQAFSWPGSVAALAGMVLAASGMAPALAAQPQPWEITLQPDGSPIMEMIHAFNNGTLIGSDTMGFHRITIISPTSLESCFTDNGSGAIVSSCGIIEREQ